MRRVAKILRHSVSGLGRNRVRTVLMMLGPFVGVAALTVILAIGRGAQGEVAGRMERMLGGSSMLIRAGGGQVRIGAHGPPTTTLTLEDVRAVDAELDEVEQADAMLFVNAAEVIANGQSRRLPVRGHTEAAEIVWDRSVSRGAYFTAAHVAGVARVALVGEAVARDLFEGQDPVGQQFRIGGVPFQVLGVLEKEGLDPHGIDLDNLVIIPVTTLMRRVRNQDWITGAKLAIRTGTDLEAVEARVGEILRRRHGLVPGQADDFMTFTPRQAQQRIREANRVFTVLLPMVAGLLILVGGLVVANLMLLTVQDRRAEIGLRQAVGARPADIRLQVLAEATLVTGLAGLLAVGLGAAGIQVAAMHGATAGMQWNTALLGLAVAVVVGVAAGLVPAQRAAGLDPVQTLR